VKTASRWLASLDLPRDLSGQTVDLRERVATLECGISYREMVLEAARRELKKRGAREVLMPEV